MLVERRFSKGAEVRAVTNADTPPTSPTIAGYAAVFNENFVIYSDDDFQVTETIAPGAFGGVMDNDVRCLFNHDPNMPLGRTTNETLRLMQDDKGLAYNNAMDSETHVGRSVYQFVKRGDVTGCSFAFIVGDGNDTWTEEERNGKTEITRTIMRIKQLFDVGPVTYPAYEQTVVDARKFAAQLELRSGPFSGMPEDLVKRIQAGRVISAEVKAAYLRQTEIRTTL